MSERPVILLTGATGFVGRQVLKALANGLVSVRLVLREGREAPAVENLERVVRTEDLFAEASEWWQQTCTGVDTVIHVAWYGDPGRDLQSVKNIDCLIGTLNLARGAIAAGARRIVGVGTCLEYELGAEWLDVETPLIPKNLYAGAKIATYHTLSQWLPAAAVEFAWCRLFYLYGEGEDPRRLIPYLHNKLAAGEPAELTKGTQVRDYLDVRKAGKEIVEVSMGKEHGALNICSGVPITVREMAEQVADRYGRRDLLKFGVRPDNLTDPQRVVGIPGNAKRGLS